MLITFLVIFAIAVWVTWPGDMDWFEMDFGTACFNSAMCVLAAMIFGVCLWAGRGPHQAAMFFTGYVMEKALSVDNLVAFTAVFSYFRLPKPFEPKILATGIVSAVVFRLLFTLIGVGSLVLLGRPMELVFAFLVSWSAALLMLQKDDDEKELIDHNNRWYVKMLRRRIPVTGDASQPVFFQSIPANSKRAVLYATPLLICLLAIEATDLMFSFDSVPTVIAVSREPLIIYTSMLFAILGLRSMYFMLDAVRQRMRGMNTAISCVLYFVAAKLVIHALTGYTIGPLVTLAVVIALLTIGYTSSARQQTVAP